MALTYEQLQKWNPAQVEAVADALNRHVRKGLVDQQDEMDAGRPPADWTGDAAERARSRHSRLVDGLNDIAASVGPVISAIDEAGNAIKKAQDTARHAVEEARSKGLKVTFDGATVKVENPDPGVADLPQQASVQGYVTAITDALGDADEADATLAGVLASVKSGAYDGGHGSIAQAALPPELRGLSHEQIIDKVMEDPGKYAGYVDQLPVEDQKEIGERVAAVAEEASRPSVLGGGEYKIGELNGLLGAFDENKVVSTSFLNDLGPDGVMKLNQRIALMQSDPESSGTGTLGGVGGGDEVDDSLAQEVGELQTNLGVTLSAGTSGLTADGQAGSDSHVSSDWVAQLVASGDDQITIDEEQGPYGSQSTTKVYGYQMMGPMLRSASSGYLLNEVGDGMLSFETDFAKDHDGHTPWGLSVDEDGESNTWPNGTHIGGNPNEHGGGIRLDWTQGYGADDRAGFDPMDSLLDGLSNNPDAARDFFDGASVDIGDGDERRTDYLMTDRDWPDDGTEPPARPDGTFSGPGSFNDDIADNGPSGAESLGSALKSATMDNTLDAGDRTQMGHILDDIVTSTADDDALSQEGDDHTKDPVDVDAIRPELRKDMGEIFGYHAETLHDSMSGERIGAGGSDSFGPFKTTFSEEQMRRFLIDAGKDPDAYETLRQAEYAESSRQLQDDLAGHPEDPHYVVSNHVGGMGDVLGALDYGANKADILDTLTADSEHNDDVHDKASMLRVLESGAGLLPGASSPLGWALDQSVSANIDDWEQSHLEDHSGTATYDAGSLQEARKQMMKDLVDQVMCKEGYDLDTRRGTSEDVEDTYSNGYDEASKLGDPG